MNQPDDPIDAGSNVAVQEAARPKRLLTSKRPIEVAKPPLPRADDDDEKAGVIAVILRSVAFKVVAAALPLGGLVYLFFVRESAPKEAPRKAPESRVVMVQLPPPPPPPPPPKVKPPEPPKDEKRPETPQEAKPEPKPEAPKPVEKPPEGLGTNIKGPGAGFAGLGSSGNGVIGGTGSGPGGGGGNAGRAYAGRLGAKLAETLRAHPRTRNASGRVEVNVWVDPSGRVTRAALVGSTGDSALDSVLTSEVITGVQLPDGPPKGVIMPITLRINASRQR